MLVQFPAVADHLTYLDQTIDYANYTVPPAPNTHYNTTGGTLHDIEEIVPGRTSEDCTRFNNVTNGHAIVVAMSLGIIFPPIDVDADFRIQNGNHRYYASLQNGYTQIPIVIH